MQTKHKLWNHQEINLELKQQNKQQNQHHICIREIPIRLSHHSPSGVTDVPVCSIISCTFYNTLIHFSWKSMWKIPKKYCVGKKNNNGSKYKALLMLKTAKCLRLNSFHRCNSQSIFNTIIGTCKISLTKNIKQNQNAWTRRRGKKIRTLP